MTDESRQASGPRRPSRLFIALLAAIGAMVVFCFGAADAAGESERWLKRARTAMAAGHWPVAHAWLDRIVREHPDAPAAQEAQKLLPECRQKCAEP